MKFNRDEVEINVEHMLRYVFECSTHYLSYDHVFFLNYTFVRGYDHIFDIDTCSSERSSR